MKRKNVLFMPRIILAISIVGLSIISYFLISTSTNALLLNSAVTRFTNRQRTLSQQIINALAADNLEGKEEGTSIQTSINNFTNLENYFLHGDSAMDITPLKQNLHAGYKQLDLAYNNLMNNISINLSNDINGDFIKLLKAEDYYLQQLDEFVSQLNSYSNQQVKKFKIEEISILLFSLLIIFSEIIFIFFPAINRIEKQNKMLTEIAFNEAHLIRRPLTNIQSLLSLISESKPENTDTNHLVQLAISEANELDDVIKQTVKKTFV